MKTIPVRIKIPDQARLEAIRRRLVLRRNGARVTTPEALAEILDIYEWAEGQGERNNEQSAV